MATDFKVGDRVRYSPYMKEDYDINGPEGRPSFDGIHTVVGVFNYQREGSPQNQCVDLEGYEYPEIKDGRFGGEWFERL